MTTLQIVTLEKSIKDSAFYCFFKLYHHLNTLIDDHNYHPKQSTNI